MCGCQTCQDGRRFKAILATLEKEDAEFLDKMLGHIMEAETEAVYWKEKYYGRWPSDKPRPLIAPLLFIP